MKVTRSAKKSAPTPGKIKRSLLAGPLLVAKENTNPSKSTKLLITNLDHNVTDSDICELFSEFGSIREVAVHYNCWGYSLGTAHVVFLNHDNAAEAARRYNGVPFDGRPMTITVEGAPHGAFGVQKTLPVKMRLSFGPNHMSNGRNPLSQVNVPTRGRPPKGLKRLESGPKGFGGLTKPRGRPAVLGNGKTVGRLPTAAELDMELDEYLSQKNKKAVVTKNKDKENDDFGYVNEVMIAGGVTPQRSAKKKRTPKGTPKTPGTSNASRTTPGKTPKRSPGRPPKRPLGRPPKKTPTGSPKVTPKTPGNQPGTTPFKVKLVRGPQKTPKKTETQEEEEVADPAETGVIAVEEPVEAEVTATAEDPNETETAAEEPIEEEAVAEEPTEEEAVAEEPTEEEAVAEEPTETDAAAEEPTEAEAAAEESEDDVVAITLDDEEAAVPPSKRTLKTPAKIKSQPAKKAVETPSRRRTTRAPSKTPIKTELAKKRKASDDEPLEEGEVSDNEETVLPDLPDLSKSAKKLNKRRSGRFAGSAN